MQEISSDSAATHGTTYLIITLKNPAPAALFAPLGTTET